MRDQSLFMRGAGGGGGGGLRCASRCVRLQACSASRRDLSARSRRDLGAGSSAFRTRSSGQRGARRLGSDARGVGRCIGRAAAALGGGRARAAGYIRATGCRAVDAPVEAHMVGRPPCQLCQARGQRRARRAGGGCGRASGRGQARGRGRPSARCLLGRCLLGASPWPRMGHAHGAYLGAVRGGEGR